MRMKFICRMLCFALLLGLAGCGGKKGPASTSHAPSGNESIQDSADMKKDLKTVAVSMPSQASEKWISSAAAINAVLQENGCQALVEFAEDDAKRQISQLEEFIKQSVGCLIVAPVPSADLTEVLEKAKKKNIPVIAYDRLVMETDAVDYYAGFDNRKAGRQIGEYIVREKKLDASALDDKDAPCTIEFFMGDPQDYSAKMVHQGILEVLEPYLEAGRLVCKSGRIKFQDTAILYESRDTAQKNCEALLDANYLDGHLDIACTSSDSLAYGIRTALENREYTPGSRWPLVTGQDAELAAVTDIVNGYQAMSVFRDTRKLAEHCAEMAVSCIQGRQPETNDRKQYKNGTKEVPSYLCGTQMVDKENYKEILAGSGYYTKDQLP